MWPIPCGLSTPSDLELNFTVTSEVVSYWTVNCILHRLSWFFTVHEVMQWCYFDKVPRHAIKHKHEVAWTEFFPGVWIQTVGLECGVTAGHCGMWCDCRTLEYGVTAGHCGMWCDCRTLWNVVWLPDTVECGVTAGHCGMWCDCRTLWSDSRRASTCYDKSRGKNVSTRRLYRVGTMRKQQPKNSSQRLRQTRPAEESGLRPM